MPTLAEAHYALAKRFAPILLTTAKQNQSKNQPSHEATQQFNDSWPHIQRIIAWAIKNAGQDEYAGELCSQYAEIDSFLQRHVSTNERISYLNAGL